MSVRSFKRAHARRQAREHRRTSTLRRKGGLVASLALTSSTLMVANAQAATYTVTGTGDDPSGTLCNTTTDTCATLRDALTQVNSDATPDTIDLTGLSGTITLTNGELSITAAQPLTITAPGASHLAVDANLASRVLNISSADNVPVSISGLTMENGAVNGTGGGISSTAELTLTNDVLTGSKTTGANQNGGGLYLYSGAITLSGSTVSGNTSTQEGGGIYVHPGYDSTTHVQNAITVTNSTISGNTASTDGGGLYLDDVPATISGTTFSDNAAAQDGGGLAGGTVVKITNSHFTNNQATASSGSGGGGGAVLGNATRLTLTGSTVSGNSSHDRGGGLALYPNLSAVVQDTTISGNTSRYGGGVSMQATDASTKLLDSTVSGNQAPYGAGVSVAFLGPSGTATIEGSTITGNAGGANSFGGGLLLQGYVYGAFDLLDSTISGNTATTGGGVSLGDPYGSPLIPVHKPNNIQGSVAFDNSTIAANTASTHAGGIYLDQYSAGSPATSQSGTASLTSTIVAGNTAAGISDDLERAFGSTTGGFVGAFSLVQSPGAAPLTKNAVITGIGPQLGPLADNGGPTQTMLPAGTSPVIDQGKSAASLLTDQRGMPRLVDTALTNPVGGDGTDIGAVELPASSVVLPPGPTPPPTPPSTPTSGITLSIHGASLSASSRQLLVGNQTPVTCAVKTGTLNSCAIEVRVGRTLLGNGQVIAHRSTQSLTTQITPTKAGLAYLKHRPLGSDAIATLVASQSAAGSPTVTGNVHFLAGPSITVGLGTRSTRLSKNVVSELNRVAKLLKGTKSVTCTAYSDTGKKDVSLTQTQAKNTCARLKKDGLSGKYRVVGRGHAKPVSKTRAANRRVVVSFTF